MENLIIENECNVKCGVCKCWRTEKDFVSKNRKMKSCNKCRERSKKNNIENADKIKEKSKNYRIENADKIKEKREKTKKTNPLHFKFKNMISASKSNDKKHNRTYDEDDFITEDFLNELWINQNGKCFYECCNIELSLEFNKDCRNPNQISVQRVNNNIAHIKENVVLSCYFCNCVKHMENCDNEIN